MSAFTLLWNVILLVLLAASVFRVFRAGDRSVPRISFLLAALSGLLLVVADQPEGGLSLSAFGYVVFLTMFANFVWRLTGPLKTQQLGYWLMLTNGLIAGCLCLGFAESLAAPTWPQLLIRMYATASIVAFLVWSGFHWKRMFRTSADIMRQFQARYLFRWAGIVVFIALLFSFSFAGVAQASVSTMTVELWSALLVSGSAHLLVNGPQLLLTHTAREALRMESGVQRDPQWILDLTAAVTAHLRGSGVSGEISGQTGKALCSVSNEPSALRRTPAFQLDRETGLPRGWAEGLRLSDSYLDEENNRLRELKFASTALLPSSASKPLLSSGELLLESCRAMLDENRRQTFDLYGFDGLCFSSELANVLRRTALLSRFDLPLLVEGEPGSGRTTMAKLALGLRGVSSHRVFECGPQVTRNAVSKVIQSLEQPGSDGVILEHVDRVGAEVLTMLTPLWDTAAGRRVVLTADRSFSLESWNVTYYLNHRLQSAKISHPALRDRPADILGQFLFFLLDSSVDAPNVTSLGAGALEQLNKHAWPGGSRELRLVAHAARRAAAGGRIETLPIETLSIEKAGASHESRQARRNRRVVVAALRANNFDLERAAETLGLSQVKLEGYLSELDSTFDLHTLRKRLNS